MGKRGGRNRRGQDNAASGPHTSLSLREEASGKKQSHNIKSILKLQHLQNIASWASKESSVPSLASFYGRQFAASREALCIPSDPSLFPCERCETILQPGFNCTVRVEKNKAKKRRHGKKISSSTENCVVYTCQFCSHRNTKNGTPKRYMRQMHPPKEKLHCDPESVNSKIQKHETTSVMNNNVAGESPLEKGAEAQIEANNKVDVMTSPIISVSAASESPTSSFAATGITLLDSKRKRKNKSGNKKLAGSDVTRASVETEEPSETSRKRRRKSWTTLKEIALSSVNERSKRINNISIPFSL